MNGTPIPHVYTQYNVSFVATNTSTNISFAFREDPAFLFLDDIVVKTGVGPNLILNPGFELGVVGDNAPANWTYLNSFGATFAGVVANNGPHTGSNNYFDGAVQAYDGITQNIATTTIPGIQHSSELVRTAMLPIRGGNGIDLLVYAGAVPTLSVPEPSSLVLLAAGLAGLAGLVVIRRKQVVQN